MDQGERYPMTATLDPNVAHVLAREDVPPEMNFANQHLARKHQTTSSVNKRSSSFLSNINQAMMELSCRTRYNQRH